MWTIVIFAIFTVIGSHFLGKALAKQFIEWVRESAEYQRKIDDSFAELHNEVEKLGVLVEKKLDDLKS